MTLMDIEREFKTKVCDSLSLVPEGIDRYKVFTPFLFEDGDHLAIVLKKSSGHWVLSDEGHTYMHLTYEIDEKDLRSGTRQKIITNALSAFAIQEIEGELIAEVPDGRYGDVLFNFVQGLLKVTDVTFLSRERVRSSFIEDFRNFIADHVPASRRVFQWNDPAHDQEKKYIVDCRINGMPKPLFVFALPSEEKVSVATISLLQFERWGINHKALGIYEDQEQIGRKVVARFSDVCDKQFSSFSGNRDRIQRYFEEALRGESQ